MNATRPSREQLRAVLEESGKEGLINLLYWTAPTDKARDHIGDTVYSHARRNTVDLPNRGKAVFDILGGPGHWGGYQHYDPQPIIKAVFEMGYIEEAMYAKQIIDSGPQP